MVRAIGIDLGTTYTVVATVQDGRPKIIPNAEGQNLTPSVVGWPRRGEPLVGYPARHLALTNPERAVFSIKRRMGSDYRVTVGEKQYTPQEVSSLILRKVKRDAESYLGERIDRAVITVPAYFNDRQRQATKEASALAGLEVLRTINEPTAAALAYGLNREEAHTVLVWDLGGGTFDVSILELGEGIFEVRAVSGDSWLGGDDFDSRLMDHLAAEYERASGARFPEDGVARQRLKEVAERAKIELSSSPQAQVRLTPVGTAGPEYVKLGLTRERLERLTRDLLERMVVPTKQALTDAGLTPQEIGRVILVGGATRMPAVRDLARKLLGQEPYRYINPDEVVAMGAAIQAGVLLGFMEEVALLDVLPLSLGVETQGGLMSRIVPRNTPLPASGARIFTTAADFQTSMDIHLLQGERELASDNISLGRCELNGIPAAPRGVAKVEVAVQADMDGIVHVLARDLLTESEVKANLTSTKFLDPLEIRLMAEEALRSVDQDREKRQRIAVSIEAQNLTAAAEMVVAELGSSRRNLQQILQAAANLQEALVAGVPEDIKTRCGALRQLLAAIHKDRTILSENSSENSPPGESRGGIPLWQGVLGDVPPI